MYAESIRKHVNKRPSNYVIKSAKEKMQYGLASQRNATPFESCVLRGGEALDVGACDVAERRHFVHLHQSNLFDERNALFFRLKWTKSNKGDTVLCYNRGKELARAALTHSVFITDNFFRDSKPLLKFQFLFLFEHIALARLHWSGLASSRLDVVGCSCTIWQPTWKRVDGVDALGDVWGREGLLAETRTRNRIVSQRRGGGPSVVDVFAADQSML